MWKYTGTGESIPGIPREDIPDAEFDRLSAEYDTHFSPEQAGSLKHCGLYKHVKDAAPSPPKEE